MAADSTFIEQQADVAGDRCLGAGVERDWDDRAWQQHRVGEWQYRMTSHNSLL